ncbi:MAG: protein YgfX [Salinisphaeraceae bacterium]
MTRQPAPLDIPLRPSGRLLTLCLIIHVAAALLVGWLALRWPLILLLLPLMAFSLRHEWRRLSLRRTDAVVHLRGPLDEAGWQLTYRDGTITEARLAPTSVCLPWLVLLHFRHRRWRLPVPVPLASDSVDGEMFRRLRVVLRTRG